MDINDRDLLAKTLQAEAGNQGLGGMLAAGSVIMNRAQTPGYGNGLRGVILKPGQFSAWNSLTGYAGGEQGQDMLNMRPSSAAYQAADKLLTGDYQDQTGGATHYYNPSISNPKWGQKRAGGDWQRIGDHIFGFADAGRGKRSPQATLSTQGTAPMMQQEEEAPRGLLGGLGVQKMQEGAPGETGQRFYERDSFKDTAALLAQGFGRMGIMGMEEIADGIAKQRTEAKAKNKTLEYLRKMPNGDQLVELAQALGPKAVAEFVMKQQLAAPKAPEYETKVIKLADGSEVMVERMKGTNDPWQPSQLPAGGTTGTGAPTKKLTEGQSKLTLFQTLQQETQPVLLELEKQFDPANFTDPTMARLPIAGNYFKSPEYQMYEAAASAWAEGALRIATGAAAQQPEIERNIKTYFAQPGDTPQTVAFKAQMREMYDRAVKGALGQAPTGERLPIPTPADFATKVTGGSPSSAVNDVNTILGGQ